MILTERAETKKWAKRVAKLTKQRDDLLEACEKLLEAEEAHNRGDPLGAAELLTEATVLAEAAIAKVRGEQ